MRPPGLSVTPAADAGPQAGVVKATAGTLTATRARARRSRRMPWSFDFEGTTGEAPPPYWVNSTGKFFVRDHGGSRALMKRNDIPLTKRGRLFLGPNDASDYTVEADVLATEKRRQMGDGGVIAQRYALVLFGNAQKLELQPWQANPARTVEVPFAWKPRPGTGSSCGSRTGRTARPRCRARPGRRPSPSPRPGRSTTWTACRTGRAPPGIYADASAEIFFDNIKVTANQ